MKNKLLPILLIIPLGLLLLINGCSHGSGGSTPVPTTTSTSTSSSTSTTHATTTTTTTSTTTTTDNFPRTSYHGTISKGNCTSATLQGALFSSLGGPGDPVMVAMTSETFSGGTCDYDMTPPTPGKYLILFTDTFNGTSWVGGYNITGDGTASTLIGQLVSIEAGRHDFTIYHLISTPTSSTTSTSTTSTSTSSTSTTTILTTTTASTTTTTTSTTTTSTASTTTTTTSTGSTTTTNPLAPGAPTNLISTGSLDNINLTWEASSGTVTGYNVYRSTDGSSFTKLTLSPITDRVYNDSLSSADDGVLYYYSVTGVNGHESSPSNTTHNVHGTRLAAYYDSGFTTSSATPYVVEGLVTIEGGTVTVNTGTKMYVVGNSTLDIEQGNALYVHGGLFSTVCLTTEPATVTSHHVGGDLANAEGFYLNFDGADDNSIIQNATIKNLVGNSSSFNIQNCSPRFTNSKLSANSSGGFGYMTFFNCPNLRFDHNTLDKMDLQFGSDFRATNIKFEFNRERGGYYCITFLYQSNPVVSPGQIENNDFDGTRYAYNVNVTGTENIPVGNNYWNGGSGSPPTPPIILGEAATVTFDFSPTLEAAPTGCGPNW